MSLTVTAPSPTDHAAAPAASTGAATAGATSSLSQQKAALNALLRKYTAGINHGQDANSLASLARQIKTAAKALGQTVTLPQAPAGAAQASGQATAGQTTASQATAGQTAGKAEGSGSAVSLTA